MKCTLDGVNARIIAKAIYSLSKFGTDLFIEADPSGLLLRALNSSSSAVGSFKFNRAFFEYYHVKVGEENYCKIAMKACLAVFRNMKQVEQCELRIIPDQSKFQVQLKCRLETFKNTLISIVEDENIDAAVTPDKTSNIISASYKIFNEISSNFNGVEEEITFEAEKDYLTVKNYIEGSRVSDKFMRSQLKFTSAEFETYNVNREAAVTFCLKEFRAFLLFAETLNESLDLNFDEAGSPIFVKIKKYDQIECLLIMSTLSPEDISFHDDYRQTEVTEPSTTTEKRKFKQQDNMENNSSKSKKRIMDETTLSNDTQLFQFNGNKNDSLSVNLPRNALSSDMDIEVNPNALPSDVIASDCESIYNAPPKESDASVTFFDTEEHKQNNYNDEYIPHSPHRQNNIQLRSIFSRCFESTYVPREPSPNSQVYVPDSDVE